MLSRSLRGLRLAGTASFALPFAVGACSPHAGDQLELFARKELRPVWRTREEIEANLARREVPSREGRPEAP